MSNYKADDLYGYKMNSDEDEILNQFRKELLEMADLLNLPKGYTRDGDVYEGRFQDNPDYYIRYKQDCGYFLLQGERGNYNFLYGLPSQDKEMAFYLIMKQEILWSSYRFECNIRDELTATWEEKYDVDYDSRKGWMEYVISKIYEGFSIIDIDLITNFCSSLNNRYESPYWKYDSNIMSFVQVSVNG